MPASNFIRRGRDTDYIFDHAVSAVREYQAVGAGSYPREYEDVPIEEVARIFDENKKLRIRRIKDNVFLIVVPNAYAYEQYRILL